MGNTKTRKRWKPGDRVWIQSPAGGVIPQVQVELVSRVVREPAKGNRIDWPGYAVWSARLVRKQDADLLRKEWNIPYSWPDTVDTSVFESDILRRVRRRKRRAPK